MGRLPIGFPRSEPAAAGDCMAADAVDPDVAGIGKNQVVVAFLVTTLTMMVLIITAWFHNALPGQIEQQHMDRYLKRRICRFFLRREYDTAPASPEAAAAFESLLVGTNDQLLFAGLAILIAAYAKGRDLTEFSFHFAASLAGLSFAISLTALMVLKSSLRRLTVLNLLRFSSVVIQAMLLLASRSHYGTWELFVGDVSIEPWRKMFCGDHRTTSPFFFIVLVVSLMMLGWRSVGTRGTLAGGRPWADQVSFLKHSINRQYQEPDDVDRPTIKAADRPFMRQMVDRMVNFQLERSFFLEIVWLVLSFACGLKRVISLWSHCSQPHEDDGPQSCTKSTLAMGFGQITAIIQLLALFATFLSAYDSMKKARKQRGRSASDANPGAPAPERAGSSTTGGRPDHPDFELLFRDDTDLAKLIKRRVWEKFLHVFISIICMTFTMMTTDMTLTGHYMFGFTGVLFSYYGVATLEISRYQ